MSKTIPAVGLRGRVDEGLRTLTPGYFALVMATGIVSDDQRDGSHLLSTVLLVVASVTFVALLLLMAWRFAEYRSELVADLTHPLRGFGFYTWVAAANVLGSRIVDTLPTLTGILLAVSTLAWLARGYAVPWTTRLGRGERPLLSAANGSWFIWAVAAQSIAVAGAGLERVHPGDGLAFGAVVAWCVGLFLYVVAGVLVTIRLLTIDVTAEDLTPPYWVTMGAAAISLLAGTELLQMTSGPVEAAIRPLTEGACLVAWSVATWLLPGLVAMSWWRHRTHRVPLRYDSDLWCIVFPLGMYAVATRELGRTEALPFLAGIAGVASWVALLAWAVTAAAMAKHVVATILLPPWAQPS